MVKFKRFTQGILGSNTYIIWDDISLEGVIVDAGNKLEIIKDIIDEENIKVKYIILTHAHFDHIHFLNEYKASFGANIVIHEADDVMLTNPRLNASTLFGSARTYANADITVKDADSLFIGDVEMKMISTPGHTPGGMCILIEKMLFSGDTLFYSGFGRTDLGAGDVHDMAMSIEKLYKLDGNIDVYPGHGTKTTIERERNMNPFMDF